MKNKSTLVIEIEIDDACEAAWLAEIARAYQITLGKAARSMLRTIYDDDMAAHEMPEPIKLQ
jgi:hypothetical protein